MLRQQVAVDAEADAIAWPGINRAINEHAQRFGHRARMIYLQAAAA